MKNTKDTLGKYNSSMTGEFDINRHVLCLVDDEVKRITLHILCKGEDFTNKFIKTTNYLASQYKGYRIEAVRSLSPNLELLMYANVFEEKTESNNNETPSEKGVSFFLCCRRAPFI